MKRKLLEALLVTVCAVGVLGQSNGPIRLWRSGTTSTSYTSGRVQVYYSSRWGNICDQFGNFGSNEATVICHQLGYTSASSWSKTRDDSFGNDTSPTVLSGVSCSTSAYLVILQCSFDSTSSSSCTDDDDVSVVCFFTRIWSSPYSGQIRLTGGSTVNKGLVEVYCSGQWGTVCDDSFSRTDANTVCRQLGYERAYDYDHLSIRGNSSQPIWLDNVPCSSSDVCLADCINCPSDENCGHSEDVTVECYSPLTYTGTNINTCRGRNTELTNGPIRLWRSGTTSTSYTSGRVQILYNSQWGNICGDQFGNFGSDEATVICHQLGYTGASSWTKTRDDSFGIDSNPTVLSGVRCSTSAYLVILQCRFDSSPASSCTDNDDVSVTCFSTRIWSSPYSGQIRLTQGSTVNQGLVEVYCSGQWGTVCDDLFNQTDANTVCRQLGYERAFDYDHLSIRGSTSQPIWLDDVPCSSSDVCLADCINCPSDENCGHSEDVTVECYSPVTYTGTTINTCRGRNTESIRVNTGAIIGGTIGGVVVLIIAIVILRQVLLENKRKRGDWFAFNNTRNIGRPNIIRAAVATSTTTTTSSQPVSTEPAQAPPPAPFNLPRPEAQESAFTYNQPSNPTISDPPPPAYGTHDKYSTYNEQSDLPPPYQPPYVDTAAAYPTAPQAYPPPSGHAYPPPTVAPYPPPGAPLGDAAYPPPGGQEPNWGTAAYPPYPPQT